MLEERDGRRVRERWNKGNGSRAKEKEERGEEREKDGRREGGGGGGGSKREMEQGKWVPGKKRRKREEMGQTNL